LRELFSDGAASRGQNARKIENPKSRFGMMRPVGAGEAARHGLFEKWRMEMMHVHTDGGRAAAGYTGTTGDCCARAFAIATGRPYQEVYDRINALAKTERRGVRKRTISNARTGVHKNTAHRLAYELAHEYGLWPHGLPGTTLWTPTMFIGQGCKVHLRADELPKGRLVVALSKHYSAVIDGVIHDTYDPARDGSRCVYGYWLFKKD
jgi:hypothetical protein